MGNIIEDDGMQIKSHRIISTDKLLHTHSEAIKNLLQQISNSYHITIDDAALAVANAMTRLGEK